MTMLNFKGNKRQYSGQMGQDLQDRKFNRSKTSQANWGMW